MAPLLASLVLELATRLVLGLHALGVVVAAGYVVVDVDALHVVDVDARDVPP